MSFKYRGFFRVRHLGSIDDVNQTLSQFILPRPTQGGYKLANMLKIAEYLGNPEDQYTVVHVAGTSGKTSTCYYIADLLYQNGLKVGLTVSPHVDKISERAQINLRTLPDEDYCKKMSQFLNLIDESQIQLSYFEVNVMFAFWLFRELAVDCAVVEVGLGGLLDGTNIIKRPDKRAVITDIGLDHVEILGDTLEKIAYQKAGIIKPHNQVFMNQQGPEVMTVVEDSVKQAKAELTVINQLNRIKSLPEFQSRNYQLARVVAQNVLENFNKQVNKQSEAHAQQLKIPARMETIKIGDRIVILDISHNAQKINALTDAIKEKYYGRKIRCLLSLGENKLSSSQEVIEILHEVCDDITLTSFNHFQDEPREALNLTYLKSLCQKGGFKHIAVIVNPVEAYLASVEGNQDILLVTGSYFLLNHIRPLVIDSN